MKGFLINYMNRLAVLFFLFCNCYAHTQFLLDNVYPLPIVCRIPKVVHQIWVGKKEIPENYQRFMKTWKAFHPEWDHKLWTDKDVEDFPWQNKELFLKCTNPGMKSDIWRYEILYTYGGLYVDTDMECRRPFDPIHSRLEFYAGLDNDSNFIIANALIGSAPRSKILKSMIDSLSRISKTINIKSLTNDEIQRITGPGLLTKFTSNLLPLHPKNSILIFDRSYFQPVDCGNGGIPQSDMEVFYIENTCFSIHHNGCSWIK